MFKTPLARIIPKEETGLDVQLRFEVEFSIMREPFAEIGKARSVRTQHGKRGIRIMNIKTKRESNLELLRIFSLMMIILHHLVYHCFYPQLTDPTYIEHFGNDLFTEPIFSKRLLIPEFILPFGKVAVIIFMMISGYFLIVREGNINLKATAGKLISQVLFAACFLTIVSSLCYAFSSGAQNQYLSPASISWFNDQWWFAGFYFLIVTAGAIFLNKILNRMPKETYMASILVLFAVLSFDFSGTLINNVSQGLRILLAGLLGYMWGGYCRRFDPLKNVRLWTLFFLMILLFTAVGLSYYNATMDHIISYKDSGAGYPFHQLAYTSAWYEYGIVPLGFSVILFELFRRIKIRNSVLINVAAAAVFMVFLTHDNPLVRNYWRYADDWVSLMYNNVLLFAVKLLGRAILTYLAGFGVWLLYQGLLWILKKMKPLFLR